ncbi:hypothetical protein BD310DRAFT_651940 [Dichomitus squalens]|uniref:Uncharacterized protein n=1 Tax=Dichomitus squalens TaxID=114155 RepID=A0A4Q9PP12_9APHY|nr:hypothetical protein BD310DRAFT_651940 [Dichomitus squalens]
MYPVACYTVSHGWKTGVLGAPGGSEQYSICSEAAGPAARPVHPSRPRGTRPAAPMQNLRTAPCAWMRRQAIFIRVPSKSCIVSAVFKDKDGVREREHFWTQ